MAGDVGDGRVNAPVYPIRLRWRNPDRKLVPPIVTHGLAPFWFDHGCPEKEGSEILVTMKSGRRAIFRLTKVKYNWDVDWNWYTFEFVDYWTNS